MKPGLIIADEGGNIERDTIYDSRRTKLTVDPDARPKHFDILESLSGGTKWNIPATSRTVYSEDLVRIKHNLPFRPQVLAYFKAVKATGDIALASGLFSINRAYMVLNAFPLGTEWLEAESDNQYFYIRHKAERYDGSSGDWTTQGSNYEYFVRYFIFNQPDYLIPGGRSQTNQ